MENIEKIRNALKRNDFLSGSGAFAIVDGQYGSTGKGLLASVLAEVTQMDPVGCTTSNAGPNSGHTFYYGDEKIVLRQLPSYAVWLARSGQYVHVHLNAGAIIIPRLLIEEISKYMVGCTVTIDPAAAVVTEDSAAQEQSLVDRLGSTGKGTGAALAAKVMRKTGSVMGDVYDQYAWPKGTHLSKQSMNSAFALDAERVLVEVSQGFSLSLNEGGFFPYCTSRDCTVSAAMSDAGIHPLYYRDCAMVVRTYPIRVAGNSGGCYSDQQELTWEQVGQIPELTTVTMKERRVFSWSREQYIAALKANRPSIVMANFMNYLPKGMGHKGWVETNIIRPYKAIFGKDPIVLLGYGPKNSDVELYR